MRKRRYIQEIRRPQGSAISMLSDKIQAEQSFSVWQRSFLLRCRRIADLPQGIRQFLALNVVMNLFQAVKYVEIGGVGNKGVICIALNDTGYIVRRRFHDRLLKAAVSDVLDEQIGDQQVGVRQNGGFLC